MTTRAWRKNGTSIYQAPRTSDPRSTPWVGVGGLTKDANIERWHIVYPDTSANTALYFILLAHGPVNFAGTLYLVFDGAISIRCKDGDTINFSYGGFQGTWNSTDTRLIFQDADPPPTSRPSTFKHVDIINPGTPSHALTISISGLTATITLATDPSSAVTTTNAQLQTKWNATPSAVAWGSLFITSGSPITNADAGDLHGDYSHSFSVTATNLSWAKEYDSYIAGTPFFGTGSFLRVSKQTGAYATAGDRFQVFGSPNDDPVGDWATGLTAAQVLEPTISDWTPSGTGPIWVRCTGVSIPATAVAGADIAVTFGVVDAIAGTSRSEPSLGGQLLPLLRPAPIPDPLEIISTGSGSSITDHIKIKYVGPWMYAPAVGDNMSKFVFSNVINISPGTPTKLEIDGSLVTTPITGWAVTSVDDDDVEVQGQTVNGDGVQSVGHAAKIEVFLEDQYGNKATNALSKTCVLSIVDAGSPAQAVILTGTLTRPFINGVATFNDLEVSGVSLTSVLRATCPEISAHADSDFHPCIFGFFQISNLTPQANEVIAVQYKVCDYWGNVLTDLSTYDPVTLTGASFVGAATVTPTLGVATFSIKFTTAGNYQLHGQGSQANYLDAGFLSANIKVS